jgi:hypothetical protein
LADELVLFMHRDHSKFEPMELPLDLVSAPKAPDKSRRKAASFNNRLHPNVALLFHSDILAAASVSRVVWL